MVSQFKWKARYTVLAILFVTWIVSFMDRMVMSVAIPYIAKDFHLTPVAMGVVMSAFFAGYSISQIPGGILADRFGIRKITTFAYIWWTGFTAITGAAANLIQMMIVRVIFGLGEGLYPACSFKSISVWFPQHERATANAVMLASNSLGMAITPLVVVAIMAAWGWRSVFYALCIPGIVVLFFVWMYVTDKPSDSKRVSAEELIEIEGKKTTQVQAVENKVSIGTIMKEASVWQCFFILLAFDITLWGFASWLPSYLVKVRGFKMIDMGIVASLPFFAGMIGCVLGGWISDKFFSEQRRIPIIATQLLSALFLYLTITTKSTVLMVIYQTLAGAFIKFFISAFWALPMNFIPKHVMGTAGGFINMAGQIAAFISPLAMGYLIQRAGGNFTPSFVFIIGAALVSCLIVLTLKDQQNQDLSLTENV